MARRLELSARIGTVVVRLPETSTSGYRWKLTRPDPGLALLGEGPEPPAPTALPGDEGVRAFRFRADLAGDFVITFELARSWGDGPTLDLAEVRVIVTAGATEA